MVFKLFHTYATSYHDIWIFVGCIDLTSLEISQTVGFIRRHFTREFSFAPSYCLSTRSQSRFQNVDYTILSLLSRHALFPFLCELFLPDSVLHTRRRSAHLKSSVVPADIIGQPVSFCIITWRGVSFVLSPCLFYDLLLCSICFGIQSAFSLEATAN